MHALTVSSAAVIFRDYDLSQPSPAAAKAGIYLDAAASEARLWKVQADSKVGLAIETTLLAILGLIATGAATYCIVQMANFANNDAITQTIGALIR
jgi:hypothetical protein